MTFKPGQSGNPAGRKKRSVEEKYLLAVAKSMPTKDWALVLERVKELAMRGERWAVEFYADRLIGKPIQKIAPVTPDGENPYMAVDKEELLAIAKQIVDAGNAE